MLWMCWVTARQRTGTEGPDVVNYATDAQTSAGRLQCTFCLCNKVRATVVSVYGMFSGHSTFQKSKVIFEFKSYFCTFTVMTGATAYIFMLSYNIQLSSVKLVVACQHGPYHCIQTLSKLILNILYCMHCTV